MNLNEQISRINEMMGNDGSPLPNNFLKIPAGNNNYRSSQPSKDNLPTIIKKYGIKRVIRFNIDGERGDLGILKQKDEQNICKQNGCEFYQLDPFKDQGSVNKFLNMGNTLIHCTYGVDRTGGNVGGWLFSQGWPTKKVWDYTTGIKGNKWKDEVSRGEWDTNTEGMEHRHLILAKKFGVKDSSFAKKLMGLK